MEHANLNLPKPAGKKTMAVQALQTADLARPLGERILEVSAYELLRVFAARKVLGLSLCIPSQNEDNWNARAIPANLHACSNCLRGESFQIAGHPHDSLFSDEDLMCCGVTYPEWSNEDNAGTSSLVHRSLKGSHRCPNSPLNLSRCSDKYQSCTAQQTARLIHSSTGKTNHDWNNCISSNYCQRRNVRRSTSRNHGCPKIPKPEVPSDPAKTWAPAC